MTIDNVVMWVIQLNTADLGLFQDSEFAGNLEESNSTSRRILCVLGSRSFDPISWMCKEQTSPTCGDPELPGPRLFGNRRGAQGGSG